MTWFWIIGAVLILALAIRFFVLSAKHFSVAKQSGVSAAKAATIRSNGRGYMIAGIIGVIVAIVLLAFIPSTEDVEFGGSSYSGSSNKSHECYVCGKTGNKKYGSNYYCDYCWAMVKTVDEVS